MKITNYECIIYNNNMLSEILSPVRNVPSIVYSGFLNHPHRPNISGPFGQSVSSDIGTSFTSETQKYKPKQVSFIPSNDNELLAISTTKDISGDTQFIVPTYTKPPANKLPATKDANTKHEKDTNDYVFKTYIGALSVVGLLILYRFIQKN